jgi:hypothetical protein
MRALIEKNPYEVIYRAIKGMIPKNNLREDILSQKLIVHDGPYHTQYNWMLPQFTEPQPYDINKHFGLDSVYNKDEWVIEFETDKASRPKEFKDFKEDIKLDATIPRHLQEGPKFTQPKTNLFHAQAYKSHYRVMRKMRTHK